MSESRQTPLITDFTAGILAGVTPFIDEIPFCTEADAARWVTAINAKNARGTLEYRVIDHAVMPMA